MTDSEEKQIPLLGSTNRKLAVFSGNTIKSVKKAACSADDLEKLELNGAETLVISVRPDLKEIAVKKPKVCFFDPDLACNKYGIRGFYKEMGTDRLANLVGAIGMFPQHSLGVLDFGTCTTLTYLSFSPENKVYEYIKGYILPGISSSLKALQSDTTSLPKITEMDFIEYCLSWKPSMVAKTPKASICDGMINSSLLLVQDAINFAKKEASKNKKAPFKIIITGGWAVTIQSCLNKLELDTRTTIEANLTLLGGNFYQRNT
ncbi:MAG: type III pantothenate kinase [Candidatus Caenarcaniphilales bacterium]|nr:type III pantothenate kinase [Candidatus Caenarcaniphilales bacterium]